MPPKRKADSFTLSSEEMSKAPRAGVEKASFALFLPNDQLYAAIYAIEYLLIPLSDLRSDDLAMKLQSKGAEVTRTVKDGQTADFIVVDITFIAANPNDNLDLYYLQPEWWRVYRPALVTDLLNDGVHTHVKAKHRIPYHTLKTELLPAFAKLESLPFKELEKRRRSRHYYDIRPYANSDLPPAARLAGLPSLPAEIALKIFEFFSPKDLTTAARVAKSWRALSLSNQLWHTFCIRSPIWPYYVCPPYKAKRDCQFGDKCYRKNPQHIAEHDGPKKSGVDTSTFSRDKAQQLLMHTKEASNKDLSWFAYFHHYVLPLEIDLQLIQAAQQHGKMEWIKPGMVISLYKKSLRAIKLGTTHVGGAADMPADMLPEDQFCIMQLNFAEMSASKQASFSWHQRKWPAKGILCMFTDEEMCESSVVYSDKPFERPSAPDHTDDFDWRMNPCAVHFFEAIMAKRDYEDSFGNDAPTGEWDPFLCNVGHYMLSRADPIQDDPCQDPDDMLLLQIDTDEDQLGVMWGDVGRYYFTAKNAELEKAVADPYSLNKTVKGEMQCS